MSEYIIRTNNLSKKYKNQLAVDGVNLHLKKGDIYGLVGENGSGKSTLLKLIMGINLPTSGDIEIFGDSGEAGLNEARKSIGAIIESPAFFPYMSARKNLAYYGRLYGLEDRGLIEESLDQVGLGQLGKKKFKDFSLGMKQRLAIGLSLMINPEVLILDEPINGLDPKGIIDLRSLILKINRERKVSVIISSHILDELSQIATVYGFLDQGSLVKEIRSEELSRECREFLAIVVDDPGRATTVLEEELKTLNYKLSDKNTIQLYDYVDRPEEVLRVFYENQLAVKSISSQGMKLEDYYMELIGGYKNA